MDAQWEPGCHSVRRVTYENKTGVHLRSCMLILGNALVATTAISLASLVPVRDVAFAGLR